MDIYEIRNAPKTITALISSVEAGHPLEVAPEVERIDPLELLTKGSDMCVLVKVRGESMTPLVVDGDWVVIDRGRLPHPGDVVLVNLNGGYTVKTLDRRHGLYLVAANELHETRKVEEFDEFGVIGTVTMILHPMI